MSKNLIDNQSYGMYEGLPKTYADTTLLWSGSADVGDTITLSEAFTNFKQLIFVAGGACGVVIVGDESSGNTLNTTDSAKICMNRYDAYSSGITTIALYFNVAKITATSTVAFSVDAGQQMYITPSEAAQISFSPITKIYGIGRIAN